MMAHDCHIFLDSLEDVASRVGRGDAVVDLRLFSSDSTPFDSVADRASIHRTDVAQRRFHDSALDTYLSWLDGLNQAQVYNGRTLPELLQYDAWLSLWWLLPFHIKHYVKHPLPGAFQRVLWLKEQVSQESSPLGTLTGARRIVIYSATRWSGELFRRALVAHTTKQPSDVSVWRESDAAARKLPRLVDQPLKRASRKLDSLSRQIGQLAGLAGHEAIRRLGASMDRSGSGQCDVLLATDISDWHRADAPDARFEHRYLGDTPARLSRAGIDVAWLPVSERHEHIREFRERLEDAQVPIVWDALEAGPRLSSSGLEKVTGARRRLLAARDHLMAHPALSWEGIDLSGLILDEIDEELAVHGLYHSHLYESSRHALGHLQPRVMLYRNEFYATGRTLAAAAGGICDRWAYQHATIPRHHWVYRHSGAALSGRRAFERLPAPDLFLDFGPFVTETMSRSGMSESRFREIGSLRHDEMLERAGTIDDEQALSLRRELDLPADVPVFLICAQMPAWLTDWIELLVRGLREANQRAHVVVKPHWRYRDVPRIRRTFERLAWASYSILEGDLEDMLIAADVSLTGSSTTGLESAILGTPLISYLREQPWETMPYVEDGPALPARDLESMVESIDTVLSAEFRKTWPARRREFLRRHLRNVERPACDALIDLLGDD